MTDRRPSIFQIGNVTDDGETVRVTGWGISWCQDKCNCHLMPTGHLKLHEGPDGSLGLATARPACECCQPWTADELSAVLTDLATIQAAPEVSR